MKVRIAAAVAVFAATALTGCGSAADKTNTAGEPGSKVVAGAEASAGAEDAAAEGSKAEAQLTVGDYGFTQFGKSEYTGPRVSYALVVSNKGTAIGTSAKVQVTFEDGAGGVVDSQEDYLAAVLPGSSVALAGELPDTAGVKKMTVQVLPGSSEALKSKPANFTVSKIKTKTQEYTGVKTTASVASPFTEDLEEVQAVAVYRNAKGKIIGGDFTYISFIPAGGKAAVSIESFAHEKVPAKTEVYVGLSSLSLLGD